jgi:galactokinase
MAKAPGRVNIIGEHTDYNGGLVLPIAIDRYIYVAFSPIDERRVEIYSVDLDERGEFWFGELLDRDQKGWRAYVRGVAWALETGGYKLRGLVAAIGGNVPIASGLSSSAALEVAVALAFCDSLERKPPKLELALLCRKAENEFVGVNCGIMDQYAAIFGEEGKAILLDCDQLKHDLVPFPTDLEVVICDTGVKRELAASHYNTRRAECEQALQTLNRELRPIPNLSRLSTEELPDVEKLLPPDRFKRVRHVVTENARVVAFAQALAASDFEEAGSLMHDSHVSLRDDFQVSCPELDAIVEAANRIEGTVGSRMTGAGFGGCSVNLVHPDASQEFREKVPQLYADATNKQATMWVCKPAAGATVIRIGEPTQ